MATYLYGLVLARNAPRVTGNARGLDSAPVRVVTCNELAALVSTIAEQPSATLDAVRSHDEALQGVIDSGVTAAAARFGQTFATDADVCRHVGDRAGGGGDGEAGGARIARVLEEFDGCVEMRILVADATAIERTGSLPAKAALSSRPRHDGGSGPGAAYLQRLRESEKTRGGEWESDPTSRPSLAAAIGSAVRAERVSALAGRGGAVFAHLVRRGEVGEYRKVVEALPALRGRDGRMAATIVGPLALYAFAEPTP